VFLGFFYELVKKFHLMYVITSSKKRIQLFRKHEHERVPDSRKKGGRAQRKRNNAFFVNLLKKPKSATEAVILTQKLVNGKLSAYDQVIVNSVKREKLLENLTNWGFLRV